MQPRTHRGEKSSDSADISKVRILDFRITQYINFEAEINYPEEEGIVQIEHFGMHFNKDGTVRNSPVSPEAQHKCSALNACNSADAVRVSDRVGFF
eukprot:SAG31_NODE_6592_length_1959_cov_1.082796_3_plen_96_part_00